MIPLKIKLWAKSLFPTKEVEFEETRNAKQKWRDDMKHHGFVVIKDEVVCNTCEGDCGQCGNGGHIYELQKQYNFYMLKMPIRPTDPVLVKK